jgi:hypothetical protein
MEPGTSAPLTAAGATLANRIAAWLHDRGWKNVAAKHTLAVMEALERTGTELEAWELVVATDPQWPTRQGRSEREARAVWIGERYRHNFRRRSVYFLGPKE